MERRADRIKEIQSLLEDVATDHQKLMELHSELEGLKREFEDLEMSWLELNVS